MALIGCDHALAIVQIATKEWHERRTKEFAHRAVLIALEHLVAEDRGLRGIVPTPRVAYRQDHFCLWILRRQLLVEMAGRPVCRGAIAGEYLIPIDHFAGCCAHPGCNALGIEDEIKHVVTRSESERLKRQLE